MRLQSGAGGGPRSSHRKPWWAVPGPQAMSRSPCSASCPSPQRLVSSHGLQQWPLPAVGPVGCASTEPCEGRGTAPDTQGLLRNHLFPQPGGVAVPASSLSEGSSGGRLSSAGAPLHVRAQELRARHLETSFLERMMALQGCSGLGGRGSFLVLFTG